MRTPAEKASLAIKEYTQNAGSMSVFKRRRAEENIRRLLDLAGREKRVSYEKAFINLATGKITVSKLDKIAGWVVMEGQTLNRLKYPKVFNVIGHKHTYIPLWAKVLGVLGFKYHKFTLPKV